ncbi:hypothetical protein [Mucilaginibacter sp. dw_454]|uniref:hypothetical protein n=1 Tax=Mucilaginibacter sp. dw_454 TaxID=2720079 RepID=UPI001BD53B81|nr:hypothetical protein [Mucilaginibacter sp. dw_454]
MTKQAIIEHTIEVINQLPEDKAVEIAEFADLLIKVANREDKAIERMKRIRELKEELTFDSDVQSLASGQSFDFLKDEEDLYTIADLKEVYAKR